MQQAGEQEAKGSWMLIQILFKDYSRFGKVQLADLSCSLSALVTMPTALVYYNNSSASQSRDTPTKEAKWQSIGPQTQDKLLISLGTAGCLWDKTLCRGEDFDSPTHFHTYCFQLLGLDKLMAAAELFKSVFFSSNLV